MTQKPEAYRALFTGQVVDLDEALLGFAEWYGPDDNVPVWGDGATRPSPCR